MARNDDGEFELVLGNRQLVSVFLIVVILLGVFFSMGYIVGRNSSPLTVADGGSRNGSPGKAIVVESPPQTVVQPPVESAPASNASAPPASRQKPEPAHAPETPTPAKKEERKRAEDRPTTPSSEEPRSGQTYLQVVATTRPDAEIVAESLAKKGFRTTVAPGPNTTLFRVLVGPTRDAADLAEMRVKLESSGFKPYVRRY